MEKFWSFKNVSDSNAEMRIEGVIANETWWGDEITPKMFKNELKQYKGKNIRLWISSPGGDVFAASQIYNALMDIKKDGGTITVLIDDIAASAATVIAMAGDEIEISPVGMMMIHKPLTALYGNADDLEKMIDILDEVQASIRNAYQLKTGLTEKELDKLINAETYMNAYKAVELGFADKVMFTDDNAKITNKVSYSPVKNNYTEQIYNKIKQAAADGGFLTPKDSGTAEEISALNTKLLNLKKEMVTL